MVAGTPRMSRMLCILEHTQEQEVLDEPLEVCRMTEYVKIRGHERSYGEESLLQSQLNLVNLLKRYQEYEKLRKQEIFLKIELKKKVGESNEFLEHLSKLLPESKLLEEEKQKQEMQKEITKNMESPIKLLKKKEKKESKTKLSLDEELEEIRKKLEKLH